MIFVTSLPERAQFSPQLESKKDAAITVILHFRTCIICDLIVDLLRQVFKEYASPTNMLRVKFKRDIREWSPLLKQKRGVQMSRWFTLSVLFVVLCSCKRDNTDVQAKSLSSEVPLGDVHLDFSIVEYKVSELVRSLDDNENAGTNTMGFAPDLVNFEFSSGLKNPFKSYKRDVYKHDLENAESLDLADQEFHLGFVFDSTFQHFLVKTRIASVNEIEAAGHPKGLETFEAIVRKFLGQCQSSESVGKTVENLEK